MINQSVSDVFAEGQEGRRCFLVADMTWTFAGIVDSFNKHFRLPRKTLETNTPDLYDKVLIEKNVAIPMRDGIRLYANIYKPQADGRFSVVLIRLPYGKDEYYCWMPAIGKFWAKKGYICVIQDVRGKFTSEGVFEPFVNESNDGYDTLDWIAKQTWCNGNIGMFGESYYGYTTWAAATTAHPNLKCIAVSNISADAYRAVFQNGALCLQTTGIYPILMNGRTYQNILRLDLWHLPLISMDDEAGIPSSYYDEIIRHPIQDARWEEIDLTRKFDQIRIPTLHLAGWYDIFLKTTIDDWAKIRESSANSEPGDKHWLVIGPYDHESTTENTNRIGRLDIGDNSATTRWEVMQSFFDYWLKGVDNGFDKTPKVRLFVIGDNDWRYESDWPPSETEYVNCFLHSNGRANTSDGDGRLDTTNPTEEPCDAYTYDPLKPVSAAHDIDYWFLAKELKDRSPIEKRDDVLVYASRALEGDEEITGPISATLFASSSAKDTDLTAALVDVFPDGYSQLIQEGIIRASFREPDSQPSLIEPARVYEYHIDLWATSYIVRKGHRIRVEISSSNFDRFDRNPNTGNEFGMSSETMKAEQTIYHTAEYPSHITLPIILR